MVKNSMNYIQEALQELYRIIRYRQQGWISKSEYRRLRAEIEKRLKLV